MKICIFRHPETIHVRKWAVSLAEEGFEVSIAYFEGDLDAWEPLPVFSDLEKAGVKVEMLKIRKTKIGILRKIEKRLIRLPFLNPYSNFQTKAFKDYLKRTNPDILHSFGFDYYGFWGVRTGFSPHLATVLGSDISEPEMSYSKKNRIITAANADCIHLHDKYGQKRLLQLGAKPTNFHIHQWGVDTHFYNPKFRSEKIRKEFLGDSKFLITCIRNLRPLYNLHIFLRAAHKILESHPQIHFLLVGKGSQRKELENLVMELGIENQVTFTGGVSSKEVATFLACSDVVVDTYQAKHGGGGIGMGILEAMASGVPPVTVSNPWIDNLMTKYEFGYRYKGGDVSDLVSKLIRLLENPQRKVLGKKCREVVLENYDWQNSINQIKNLYDELNK
jgi:glycosyltransferase involved in cell wall biosynthesis